MFNTKEMDPEILNICERLLKRALNCEFEEDDIKVFPDQIDNNNLQLLFVIPGVLLVGLSKIIDEKIYYKRVSKLKVLFENETDPQKIIDEFGKLLTEDDESDNFRIKIESNEFSASCHKLIHICLLLFYPISSSNSDENLNAARHRLRGLVCAIGNYLIFCCLILKKSKKNEDENWIYPEEVNAIIKNIFDGELKSNMFLNLGLSISVEK